jgi:hypothetical protein
LHSLSPRTHLSRGKEIEPQPLHAPARGRSDGRHGEGGQSSGVATNFSEAAATAASARGGVTAMDVFEEEGPL